MGLTGGLARGKWEPFTANRNLRMDMILVRIPQCTPLDIQRGDFGKAPIPREFGDNK